MSYSFPPQVPRPSTLYIFQFIQLSYAGCPLSFKLLFTFMKDTLFKPPECYDIHIELYFTFQLKGANHERSDFVSK